MFFDTWFGLVRVLVAGTLAYVALVAILSIFGNRSLAKLNAFDLVVTVALGSTLATVLLSVRSPGFRATVTNEPMLLLREGRFLNGAMRGQRIFRDEVMAALRASGVADMTQAAAVILETDGSLPVIKSDRAGLRKDTLETLPNS